MAVKKTTKKTVKETIKKEVTKNTKTKKKMDEEVLTFTDDDVDALDSLEAIRVRFDMYIGSQDPVTHMVKEILDNSIDEFLNGFCNKIIVDISTKENVITVIDNGRGLPLGMNKKLKKPTMEVLFTHVHSGAKYSKKTVKVSGGKNGVGIKTLTACGEYLFVESTRDDMIGTMEFSRCKVVQPLKIVKKKTKQSGTKIVFRPDSTLFNEEDIKLNPERIKDIIRLKCYLNAGLLVEFIVDGELESIQYNAGLSDFLNSEIKSPLFNMENIVFTGKDDDENEYDFAIAFENSTDEKILSFVNSLPTLRGTHETGFKAGLTTVFNNYIKKFNLLNSKDKNLQVKGEDVRRGLVTIISLKHAEPMFDGQTKSELTNKDINGIVRNIVVEKLSAYFDENETLAKKLCERAVSFARATNNAKEAMKKIVKVNSSSLGLTVTNKFKDCSSNDPNVVEFIVIEGDSAGGNVETGRFSKFQCVYPLKGKILNTYGAGNAKLINSNEINEFLKIMFGTNDLKRIKEILQSDEEIEKNIKSKKIIIMTDADPDGSHIRILFLNFIYEHLPELIERGYVYIALSPLYRVNVNGKWRYFMNDYEYRHFESEIISKKYKVMNPKFTVNKTMANYEEFVREFNRIKHKYSIDDDVLNSIIRFTEVSDIRRYLIHDLLLEEDGEDNYEGLHNNIWHSFNLDDLLAETSDLCELYPFQTLVLQDKTTKEEFECDIYDGLQLMHKEFRYTRNRIKGLGELDGMELRETSLNPNTRVLIQVQSQEEKKDVETELFKILFGSNPNLRKEFIGKHLL